VLQENPRSKRPLDIPRLRWEDRIKNDFLRTRGGDYGDMDWKEIAEKREEWGGFVLWQDGLDSLKKKFTKCMIVHNLLTY